jgi:ATP-dependent Zn protease
MKKVTQQRIATSYHEAGHVVIGYELGMRLGKQGVSIVSDGGSAGRAHLPFTFRNSPEFDTSDRMRLHLEKRAMIYFAGIEAQRSFDSRSVRHYHASSDYHCAVDLLGYFFESSVLEARIKFLVLRTQQKIKVKSVWTRIVTVAEALQRQEHLKRSEVEAVMFSAIKL